MIMTDDCYLSVRIVSFRVGLQFFHIFVKVPQSFENMQSKKITSSIISVVGIVIAMAAVKYFTKEMLPNIRYERGVSALQKAKTDEEKRTIYNELQPSVDEELEKIIERVLVKHQRESHLERGIVATMDARDGLIRSMVSLDENGNISRISPSQPKIISGLKYSLGECFYIAAVTILAGNTDKGSIQDLHQILCSGNRQLLDSTILAYSNHDGATRLDVQMSDLLGEQLVFDSATSGDLSETSPNNMLQFCSALFDKEGKQHSLRIFETQPDEEVNQRISPLPELIWNDVIEKTEWRQSAEAGKYSTIIRFDKSLGWVLIAVEYVEPTFGGAQLILQDLKTSNRHKLQQLRNVKAY